MASPVCAFAAAAGAKRRTQRRPGTQRSALDKPIQVIEWQVDPKTPALGSEKALAAMVGADVETDGVWDPLGFGKLYDRNFDFNMVMTYPHVQWLHEAEVKHGRVGMIVFVGMLVQQFGQIPGYPAEPDWTKALAACYSEKLPTLGLIQISVFAMLVEGRWYPEGAWIGQMDREPGDLGFDPLKLAKKPGFDLKDMQLKELKNGRLAMLAVASLAANHSIPGSVPLLNGLHAVWLEEPAARFAGLTIVAAAAYFATPLVGAAAAMSDASLHPEWMHLCNALAGGVLIGVALCHMLAESLEGLDAWGRIVNAALGGDPDESFPLGVALAGAGFFLVLGIKVLVGVDPTLDEVSDGSSAASSSQADEQQVRSAMSGGGDLSGIATWVGIGLHSIIEAVATGSAQSASAFGILVMAVLLHKGFAGFAVGTSLQGVRKRSAALWWTLVIRFASTGPVGIAIGAIARAEVEGEASALLQCLAAGTLLAGGIGEMLMPALEGKGVWKKRAFRGVSRIFCDGIAGCVGLMPELDAVKTWFVPLKGLIRCTVEAVA